jgi:hypothetical protein
MIQKVLQLVQELQLGMVPLDLLWLFLVNYQFLLNLLALDLDCGPPHQGTFSSSAIPLVSPPEAPPVLENHRMTQAPHVRDSSNWFALEVLIQTILVVVRKFLHLLLVDISIHLTVETRLLECQLLMFNASKALEVLPHPPSGSSRTIKEPMCKQCFTYLALLGSPINS